MAISSSGGNFSFASGEQHFIPEIFSKKLQAKFYANTVLAEVTTNCLLYTLTLPTTMLV